MIPITRLYVGDEEAAAAAEVIRSGWLTQGKRGEQFENMVAEYVGAQYAIAVNSCTTSLQLALIAAGVRAGEEVICPSWSFIATANAILYVGAKPVFVDIEPKTYNIDPTLVEAAITSRTSAILPVSEIGLAADLPAILAIARKHHLKVVEDAAPSFGATIDDKHVGSFSDFTCFSFDARKILTMGEGGVVTTDDEVAAKRLRSIRAHAASTSTADRHASKGIAFEEYPELGFNYKRTDIQAAIGVVQMSKIDTIIKERRRLAERYNVLLAAEERIETPFEPEGYSHVFQSYCIRLKTSKPRDAVMNELAEQGIATRRIMSIHLEPFYSKLFPGISLPITEHASANTLLLPMFVGLTDSEQDEVVETLIAALD